MVDLTSPLRILANAGGSDLHLKVGAPPPSAWTDLVTVGDAMRSASNSHDFGLILEQAGITVPA